MAEFPIIDWENQLDEIAPLLDAQGGRACVIGTKASGCGLQSYAEIARQQTERRCPGCITIKIDPSSDENTHYPFDIIRTMERKLQLAQSEAPRGTTEVFKNIHVGGNMATGDLDITLGHASWEEQDELIRRTQRMTEALAKQLPTRRVVLLLHWCETMRGRTGSWFWDHLWGDETSGLQSLTPKGLALFCCCETDARCPHRDRVPAPQFRVRLPSQYAGADRERALQDVEAMIMQARSCGSEEAQRLAAFCLENADFEPERVYGSLPALLRWGGR